MGSWIPRYIAGKIGGSVRALEESFRYEF